jgi:hypothetical protein
LLQCRHRRSKTDVVVCQDRLGTKHNGRKTKENNCLFALCFAAGKQGFFESSYHIPMIIRDPRPEAAAIRGTVVDQFSEHVDVLPTILHWLGATELPLQCDGHSLLPFLTAGEGAPSGWRTEAHWEYDWRDVTQSADAAAAEGGSPEEQMGLTMHQCGLMVSRCGGAERHGPSLLLVLHRFYPSLRVSRACLGKSFCCVFLQQKKAD